MTVDDIHRLIGSWAPAAVALERDNIGLQCGDPSMAVRGILAALDVTEPVIEEALRKRANLIVSHHPLLFRPLRAVTPATAAGRCVRALARHEIAVYSAHTNLDFSRGGTSYALAEALGLSDGEFLETPYRLQKKIVTYVPAEHADPVAAAMAEAGAGRIANYDNCSFRTPGTGTFRGNEFSNPATGSRGRIERVPEVRMEMIVPQWNVEGVLRAMAKAHPYEEPAYDVYPLENRSREFGMGVIGFLRQPVSLRTYLGRIKNSLGTGSLRWTGNLRSMVRRVAVCGGSGGDLLEAAVASGADLYVSADLKYHSFHDAAGRIALVDAGHYETEIPVVRALVLRLRKEFRGRGILIPVFATAHSTNPIHYV
jgi:dinuclear metal center YbgI/SA1388 family protein